MQKYTQIVARNNQTNFKLEEMNLALEKEQQKNNAQRGVQYRNEGCQIELSVQELELEAQNAMLIQRQAELEAQIHTKSKEEELKRAQREKDESMKALQE